MNRWTDRVCPVLRVIPIREKLPVQGKLLRREEPASPTLRECESEDQSLDGAQPRSALSYRISASSPKFAYCSAAQVAMGARLSRPSFQIS